MIAFFDTCIHVALLRGSLRAEQLLGRMGRGPIRLSPIVASELLRGTRGGRAARAVGKLVDQLVPIEPPSWRRCWIEAGKLLPAVFADHEDVGLARIQNDTLLALTARHTGAVFVTADRHFSALAARIHFAVVTV